MRRFHSYGPVDCRHHFCVPRENLVAQCMAQLVGIPEESGHYFTLWAPRQTGKTWLMRQAKAEIERRYPDRFIVGMMSLQGVSLKENAPAEAFLSRIPLLFKRFFNLRVQAPQTWEELGMLFSKDSALFEKPLILFMDEFDKLPAAVIDQLIEIFRDIYLDPERFCLHGLALIGVRTVLGADSQRGSPFNIQRSLHVPNFIEAEVADLFSQYQAESGQKVAPEVVSSLYQATRGQPGLVNWFGELLTETYHPGTKVPIDKAVWEAVYEKAIYREWNNTVLNLIKKAKGPYLPYILELFTHSDIRFRIDSEWCSYAYLNGIIDAETLKDPQGLNREVCRFSSPFIQHRLYNALTPEIVGERLPVLALDPLDKLIDVFDGPEPDMPALL